MIAGAFKLIFICFVKDFSEKFSRLSFSKIDALLIKQSNPFRVLKAFFIKVSVCFKLFKSALNKYASAPSSSNSFF